MARTQRHPLRTTIIIVVALAVVIGAGWLLVGPPGPGLPVWVRWRLPDDISSMQLSASGRFGLVNHAEKTTVIDLSTGKSTDSDEQPSASDHTFITDDGAYGSVGHTSAVGYRADGSRRWQRDLPDFDRAEVVTTSGRTAVVNDDCSRGRQRVVGLDLTTGKIRWQQTLPDCNERPYLLPSRSLFSMPGRRDDERIITTVDDHRRVATVKGERWQVRDDLLIAVQDDHLLATSYPDRKQRWTAEVCPASTGYRRLQSDSSLHGDRNRNPVAVECADGQHLVVDPRSGRSAKRPADSEHATIQLTTDSMVSVRQSADRIVGTDLVIDRPQWSLPAPAGDIFLHTTARYAIVAVNHHSHNTFRVVDIATGKDRASSPPWGDWWVGGANERGFWVTHRTLCTEPATCKLNSTYLLR